MSKFHMIRNQLSLAFLAILVSSTTLMLQGCACTEEVSLLNETEHVLHVQLALPWPSYAIASRNGCHFDVKLPPGDAWTSAKARRDDRQPLPLRMANGPTVFRVRRLRGQNDPWSVFYTHTIDPVLITVSSDRAGALRVHGSLGDGKPADIQRADDIGWFESADAQ